MGESDLGGKKKAMPSDGTCEELTEQLSESCREEDTGSESIKLWCRPEELCESAQTAFQCASGKIREQWHSWS